MSNTTNHELCYLITNVCKAPKNFDFSETVQPFRFVWFEGCPWVCYSRWEGKAYCFLCVINLWENLYKNPYQTWKTVVKIFKKHKNFPRGTHKKRQILFQRFLGEYILFLPPPHLILCLKGGKRTSVYWEN